MCLHTVHAHYERPGVHDSQLDTALRRLLKKNLKLKRNTFHYKTDIFIDISICV